MSDQTIPSDPNETQQLNVTQALAAPDLAAVAEEPAEIERQESEQATAPKKRSLLPILLIGAGGLMALIIVVGLVVLASTQLGRGFSRLDAANPVALHPDGMAVILTDAASTTRVQIETLPQAVFMDGSGGRQWVTARDALPATVEALSPVYQIDVRGEAPLTIEMAIPNGAEPLAMLDVYAWDADAGEWIFVPAVQDAARQVLSIETDQSMNLLAARVSPDDSPEMGLVVTPGGEGLLGTYGLAMPEGITINAAGEVIGQPAQADASTVLPIVANRSGGINSYDDAGIRTTLIERLVGVSAQYDGLVLDFAPGSDYPLFVEELRTALAEQGQQVHVVVSGTDFGPYNLPALATAADHIWVAPGPHPQAYLPSGSVRDALGEAVDLVDRNKLGLMVNGLSVDLSNDQAIPLGFRESTRLFGDVTPVEGYFSPDRPLAPGSDFALRLTGPVTSAGYDQAVGMNYFTYTDSDQQTHYVYFASARSISQKLDWVRYYGLSGAVVYGVAHPDPAPRAADGVTAFLSQQQVGDPSALTIIWEVTSSSGASLARQEGDLSLIQFLWQSASEPDQYTISASIAEQGDTLVNRGEVIVAVDPSAVTVVEPEPAEDEELAEAEPDD
ncbi:MAG: hypothetical protein GYB68_04525, partial [Chloroflexi bacterium]|nr:hypothetical protein [Chloroflexota bacterium]